VTTHLYQNRLAITAPLAHAKRPPPGGYVQTVFSETEIFRRASVREQNFTGLGIGEGAALVKISMAPVKELLVLIK
jgi:hypothetical protein